MEPILTLAGTPALQVEGCGIFVSAGVGRHAVRVLPTWELILVERGRLGLAVGGVDHDLGVGDWILCPAGVRHGGTRDFPPDLRFAWMHFVPVPGTGLALPGRGHVADPAPVSAQIRRLLDHQASPGWDVLIAALHLQLILAQLAAPPVAEPVVAELAARARKLIRLRFPEPDLDVAGIARALGVGRDHLGRSYRAAYGTTLIADLNQVRTAEAKRLLALGSLSIAAAAQAAGFRDPQWFRRLLQRDAGVSPRAWRRLHVRGHVNRQ